ncbi:branched-chain amino acid ABC transporter permease [Salinirubellus sp. GCM10025818]|uniref:branched-chain amino acid ABC transporter permease n=1 Tax=Salinirubellus TaxID=2162630 RepID=UPI0030CE65FD
MSASDTESEDSTGALAALWEKDVTKIGALLAVIYGVYILTGAFLGFEVRGQINSVASLTFYIAVFALLALALNLHWGYTGLFNIGIVGFMAIGIYTMAIVSKAPLFAAETGRSGGFGMPIIVGIIAGTVVAALLGLVVALPALRLRADYLAIVTIAMSEILRFAFLSGDLEQFTVGGYVVGLGGGSGLILDFTQPVQAFFTAFGLYDVYLGFVDVVQVAVPNNPKPVVDGLVYGVLLLFVVVGYYVLMRRIGNSPFGRVLKAIREDEEATNSLGKNTDAFKTKAFMVGCGLMGLGGILWFMTQGAITPNTYRPRLTFFVWIALIIGGAGSNTGSVMGGAIFAAVLFQGPRYLKNVIETLIEVDAPSGFGPAVSPLISNLDPVPFLFYTIDSIRQLQLVIMGLVLIYLMHNRPQGLLGHRKEPASGVPLERPRRASGEREGGGTPPAATDGGSGSGDSGGEDR